MKRYLILILKIAVPLGILIWLVYTIDARQFSELLDRPKNWPLLLTAFGISFVAICLTFVRWFLLVRSINLPFRLVDAFRLGFLGFLLNFVSVGAVGGDLFKAFFIAREQPRRRAEAVATVVVDRMIGLYALLLLTSTAILFSDIPNPTPALATICKMTYGATVMGGIGVLMVLIPGFTRGSVSEWLAGLPKIGGLLEQLIASVRMYRNKKLVMCAILTMSMGVHSLFALALYLIASALFATTPTLQDHLIIVPLSNVAGALPFTPGGIGTFELALSEMYALVSVEEMNTLASAAETEQARGSGLLAALTFRLVTIMIAAIGVGFYWVSRREVQELMHEAEEAQKHETAG